MIIVKVLGRMIPLSGKIHQNQEVYSINGLSPTIKATAYKNPPRILHRSLDKKNKRNERRNE